MVAARGRGRGHRRMRGCGGAVQRGFICKTEAQTKGHFNCQPAKICTLSTARFAFGHGTDPRKKSENKRRAGTHKSRHRLLSSQLATGLFMARIMVFTSLPQPAGTSRNVGQPSKPPPLTLHPMEMLTDPVNRKGHNREGCHFTDQRWRCLIAVNLCLM